jgi:hypothetical protein
MTPESDLETSKVPENIQNLLDVRLKKKEKKIQSG